MSEQPQSAGEVREEASKRDNKQHNNNTAERSDFRQNYSSWEPGDFGSQFPLVFSI